MKQLSLLSKDLRSNIFALLILICGWSTMPSCTGTKDLSVVNLSNLYNAGDRIYNPEFLVHHLSDTTSKLSILINNKLFLFSRQNNDRFSASFTIHYKLAESYESINMILDSGSVSFQVNEEDKNLRKVYDVTFRLKKKNEMLLIATVSDNQKHFEETYYVPVDNSSPDGRQNFSLSIKGETNSSFKNYINEDDSIKVVYQDPTVKKLYVRAYNRNFPLAPPPFSYDIRDEFNYLPDNTFTYEVNDTNFIPLKQYGFYHFQSDTTGKNGITIFVYPRSFPAVTSPDQMLECVRYLTTRREFDEMKSDQNKKEAMDKFWLNLGGNAERTKQLIKKYYTRIREANQYFSSYTEGWRTDRGMVYTIFGKPNSVYKSSNAESWIYGTPNNALSLNFFFTKVINPFTDNDYQLTREPLFEGSWMRAVDVWRQGRVYNDN
ncbi:MAG: GWxTD domain-containing protein [Bacteroidetes bacterium]|nr:GWxTD domain-containing protein [Bacteroidota bacterium]